MNEIEVCITHHVTTDTVEPTQSNTTNTNYSVWIHKLEEEANITVYIPNHFIGYRFPQNITPESKGQNCGSHVQKRKKSDPIHFDKEEHLGMKHYSQQGYSLVPRPHPLMRKGVWWPLSDFLVVPSQQNAACDLSSATEVKVGCLGTKLQISQSVEHMVAWRGTFHWVVRYQDCWLGTIKKSLNGHQTPFLMRGWGLGMRLAGLLPHIHIV